LPPDTRGDLQVHGGLLFCFLPRVEQSNGGGAVVGAKALLLSGHVIVIRMVSLLKWDS
jgi:hypothetical protein